MVDARGIFGVLRGQLERLFDAVEDRQGRIDGILAGLSARLNELRAEREPLEQRSLHLKRASELGRLREQHHRERARQALPDEGRALECLRKARFAAREAERIEAQSLALQPLQAALAAELDALERRIAELDALREQLRARQAVVDLDCLRRTTLSGEPGVAPAGTLPALLARWESRLASGELEREVARRLDAAGQLSVSVGADSDPDSDEERALRAELAQLMEKT